MHVTKKTGAGFDSPQLNSDVDNKNWSDELALPSPALCKSGGVIDAGLISLRAAKQQRHEAECCDISIHHEDGLKEILNKDRDVTSVYQGEKIKLDADESSESASVNPVSNMMEVSQSRSQILSASKSAFLNKVATSNLTKKIFEKPERKQISIAQLRYIIKSKYHNLPMIISGDVIPDFKEKNNKILMDSVDKLEQMKEEDFYGKALIEYFESGFKYDDIKNSPILNDEMEGMLKSGIIEESDFYGVDDDVMKLIISDVERVHFIHKKISCGDFPEIRKRLDEIHDTETRIIKKLSKESGIDNRQATVELRRLANDNSVTHRAYFFASMTDVGYQHVETLLVSEGDIINVIPFNVDDHKKITEYECEGIYSSSLSGMMKIPVEVSPQATGRECAALGLSYAKEYLKNDGNQIENFTVRLDFEGKNGMVKYFLPSPHVLRYSQSLFYNKCIMGIVTGSDDYAKIIHKGKMCEVRTLSGLPAGAINGDVNFDLKSFVEKWLCEYKKINELREIFCVDNSAVNLYLEYKNREFLKFK